MECDNTGLVHQPILSKSVTYEVIAQDWTEYFKDILNVFISPTTPTERSDLVFYPGTTIAFRSRPLIS